MTLTECFVKAEIHIDFGSEILYGSDQCFMSYPCRFATVNFELIATDGLNRIADCVRRMSGIDVGDSDGHYSFYYGLNDYAESKTDTSLSFVVIDDCASDNEADYNIDLSQDEQLYIYEQLEEQCRKYIGKSCEDLLREAIAIMEGNADDC